MKKHVGIGVATVFIIIGLIVMNQQMALYSQTCWVQQPADLTQLFPTTVKEIQEKKKKALATITAAVAQLIAVAPEDRTFANTAGVYDAAEFEVSPIIGGLVALQSLSDQKELRDAARDALLEIAEAVRSEFSLNPDCYQAFKAYATGNAKKEVLRDEERYFLEETIKAFERSGLNLPKEQLEKVRVLLKELARLSADYSKNIAEDNRTITVEKEELTGLDADFLASLQQDEAGRYVLGIDYPTVFCVLDYCNVPATRKKMADVFGARGYPKNKEVLEKVIALRDELAKTLGFASYAALDLADQMVQTPERAREFLLSLLEPARKKAEKELADWRGSLPESVVLDKGKVCYYDMRYLTEKMTQKQLGIDDRKTAEYFPLEHTIDQLLGIYEQFMNIRFQQVPAPKLWSDEVRVISVTSNKGALLGYLLLDLFPRPNKYSHAAQFSVIPAVQQSKNCPAVAVVMANFSRPQGDKPACLRYGEARTFFHEFGHALHCILGRTRLASHSGTNVKRDFVEMPSQMLEGWLTDSTILQKITKHYQTGECLPKEQADKIGLVERFSAGIFTTRQLSLGLFALDLFAEGEQKDIERLKEKWQNEATPFKTRSKEEHLECNFDHLMGYGAKYYGYLWSDVFAKDLFAHIKERGLLNGAVGDRYIKLVIGQGGQKDPNKLLYDFLGREPNNKAFRERMGFE